MESKGLSKLLSKIYDKKYHSVWTNTMGKNQSGKTDFNLLQFEILHDLKLGEVFASNNASIKCDWIELITDFTTLKERCEMLNPPKKKRIKRVFFLLSELADFVPRDQPWSNVKFIKELQKVRKYGLSVISDSIDRVDGRVLNSNHFHGYFVKYNKANPTVARYYDWTTGRVHKIKNIPRTTIPFDTFESASFYMEPQMENPDIVLDTDHLIMKKYIECDCIISKTGLHPMEVKRARDNIIRLYMKRFNIS